VNTFHSPASNPYLTVVSSASGGSGLGSFVARWSVVVFMRNRDLLAEAASPGPTTTTLLVVVRRMALGTSEVTNADIGQCTTRA